jgi:cardiolipin synthase
MSWTTIWTIGYILNLVLVGIAIIAVLRRPREPRAMLVWILALLLLPGLGLLLFVLTGEPRVARIRRRRRRRVDRLSATLRRRLEQVYETTADEAGEAAAAASDGSTSDQRGHAAADLATVSTRISQRPPTTGNSVTIYYEDEQNYSAIVEAVEAAESHIHLEYYIFQPDDTGRHLRDLLVAKARAGVEVRLLVDFVGCWNWPWEFRRSFRKGGIKVGWSLPVVPWRGRWQVNFRNHRKLLVVDGLVGFTGSQNIGDEYRGRLAKYAPWRDTHMRIVGPAVQQLQETFVEDWKYATGEELTADQYFPRPRRPGNQMVQVVQSGPDSNPRIMHHMLTAAVTAARSSVSIITPYFAPDTTMIVALQSAAYRGVRVRLLIPSASNHFVVLWAGRSFYLELAEAGVEIYEYEHTLLHSKVVIVDDECGFVGSANMDQRSFRNSFEITTILYDRDLAADLQADFDGLIAKATRIRPQSRDHWGFRKSILVGLARLVSPVL